MVEGINWSQRSALAKAQGKELWLAEWKTDAKGRTVAWATGDSEQAALNALLLKCRDRQEAIQLAHKQNLF